MTDCGEKHFLYSGQIFGMGSIDSWVEYLTYLGEDRWEMFVEEDALCDLPDGEIIIEPFTTESLAIWALERDREHMEK